MRSILQDWVSNLGLRHQGVLLTAVRGCDTAPKNDPSKMLVRCYRAVVLNAHCGDAAKARTFIEKVESDELLRRFEAFRKSVDHYPHHYVLHCAHAFQVVGYKHPDALRSNWRAFYIRMAGDMHVTPETEADMDNRLDADEDTFAARDWCCDGEIKAAPLAALR